MAVLSTAKEEGWNVRSGGLEGIVLKSGDTAGNAIFGRACHRLECFGIDPVEESYEVTVLSCVILSIERVSIGILSS